MAPGTSTPSLPHTYPARPTHSWRRAAIAQLSKIAIESILDLKSVAVLNIATAGLVPLLTAAVIAHAAVRAPARTWGGAATATSKRLGSCHLACVVEGSVSCADRCSSDFGCDYAYECAHGWGCG